jgi:hypothetical protein
MKSLVDNFNTFDKIKKMKMERKKRDKKGAEMEDYNEDEIEM